MRSEHGSGAVLEGSSTAMLNFKLLSEPTNVIWVTQAGTAVTAAFSIIFCTSCFEI